MTGRCRDHRRGLTLAELLVALAVAGLVMAIAATAARQVIAFERRLEVQRESRDQLTAGLAALRGRLERSVAIPVPGEGVEDDGAGSDDEPAALFQADASGLFFISADPGYPTEPGLYEYRITMEPSEISDGVRFVLGRRAFEPGGEGGAVFGQGGGPPVQSWDLFETRGPAQFEFSGDGGWRTDWRPQDGMPTLVRLREDGRAAPLLTVRPGGARPVLEVEDEAPMADETDSQRRRAIQDQRP